MHFAKYNFIVLKNTELSACAFYNSFVLRISPIVFSSLLTFLPQTLSSQLYVHYHKATNDAVKPYNMFIYQQ